MAGDSDSRARSLVPLPIRAHPLVLGTVLFLSSELMFFASLFAAYFDLRAKASAWPPPGVRLDVAGATIGTALLLFASVAMILASRAVDRGRFEAARWWTATALAAAVGFAAIALHGYAQETFGIDANAYASIYYTLTGVHLLHVLAGAGILSAILAGIRSRALLADRRAGFESMTYYWHFVFVVWLGIWATVYFLK